MPLHLQGFNSAATAVWTSTDVNFPGKLGSIYETSAYGGQFVKLVDAGAVAGDVVYYKKYDGSYEVTPTIGNSSNYEPAGVITTTVAANQWCFVQKRGLVSVKANGVFADGMPVWADTGSNRIIPGGVFSGSLSAAADTAGAILALINPATGAALVTSLIINRTTKSTGAGTADFGVAANGTTKVDTLIDGLDIGAAEANGENNFANAGTNGKPAVYWPAGYYITGSTATGNVAGLVATYSGTFELIGKKSLPRLGVAQGTISGGFVSVALDLPYLMRQLND